jgi:hypothetical protein
MLDACACTASPFPHLQKQRQFEQQEEPPREGFAFGREEPRFDIFQILRPRPFDRSDDMIPVERDD